MEGINEISSRFFLMKKRMRDNEINELVSKSNSSFYNVIKSHSKKGNELFKASHKFVLNAKKNNQSEVVSNHKADATDYQIVSPTSSNNKLQDKKPKAKKPNIVNKMPRDDLINIAFNLNAPKIIYPQPKKPVFPKQSLEIKQEENMKGTINNEKEMMRPTLMINDTKIEKELSEQTPAEEKDSIGILFKKEIEKEDNKNDENDKESDRSMGDYFDKKEIFDNNGIFNDDDDLIEDKPFEEVNNINNIKEIENDNNRDIEMKESNYMNIRHSSINTLCYMNNETNNELNLKAERERGREVEFTAIQNQLNKTKAKEISNEDNLVETYDSKVIISLKGFENFDFTKNEYFNNYKENRNNNDDNMNDDKIIENKAIITPIKVSVEDVNKTSNDKIKEESKKTTSKIADKSIHINRKSNKIIDDDDEREYVYLDEKQERDNTIKKEKEKEKVLSKTDKSVYNNSNLNKQNAIPPNLKKIKETSSIKPSKIPTIPSKTTNKLQAESNSKPKTTTANVKPREPEVTYSHHYHHHTHNSNINNITVINNTILPTSSSSQISQIPILNNEIKKKEYDILCLSLLNISLTKIKTKMETSNENGLSSSIRNSFDNMLNMTIQLRKEEQSKRIKIIIEKTMKLLITLFDIFKNETKREQYNSDILQILDVIDNFQHKTKDHFGDNIQRPFKIIKLVFKYIYSLFKMKTYTTNTLKNLIEQKESTNKTKSLIKFTKTFKSFNTSVLKLKKLLTKDTIEDRKQKKISEALYIYLETDTNAIKYSKCFKIGKKFCEFIFEYLKNK